MRGHGGRRGGAASGGGAGAGRGRAGRREHRVDTHLDRAGVVHDHAGAGAVLRRPRAVRQRALGAHALFRDLLPLLNPLDRRGLQPRLHRWRRTGRTRRRAVAGAPRRRRPRRPEGRHTRDRVLHVPDDVRHHHAGADRRRVCRAHPVLGRAVVLRRLAGPRLCAGVPLGVGRRLARRHGRAGLRRRAGGPPDLRRVGAGSSRRCSARGRAFPTRCARRTAPAWS